MAEIKFVYFDIGGVVIIDFSKNNKWEELLDGLQVPISLRDTFSRKFKVYIDDLCMGKKDSNEVFTILKEGIDLDVPTEYNMLMDFVERFEANPSIHSLVHAFADIYEVGLLTNMYPGMLDAIKERELLPEVDWNVVIDSSLVGLAKPYDDIFVLAEMKAKVSPENILFIENTKEHVETAQKRGWQTFLYDSADIEGSNRKLSLLFNS